MVNGFPIKFFYNNSWYTAEVYKLPFDNNKPVEFDVSNIQPAIAGLPDKFVFVHQSVDIGFKWNIQGDPEIARLVLKAIYEYCANNNIPFAT